METRQQTKLKVIIKEAVKDGKNKFNEVLNRPVVAIRNIDIDIGSMTDEVQAAIMKMKSDTDSLTVIGLLKADIDTSVSVW